MRIDLTAADLPMLAAALFDHPVRAADEAPRFADDITFVVDPARQVRLLTDLFQGAPHVFEDYSSQQVEEGLWCMMGAAEGASFCGQLWNPKLPLSARLALVDSIYALYDHVLASYPYEAIDFAHPDSDTRRFRTIDYMAPDLLLHPPWFADPDATDAASIRAGFLHLFTRLLAHDAPVAQYAALHGLGHLEHPERVAVIDTYLSVHTWLESDQRAYAETARRGDVL